MVGWLVGGLAFVGVDAFVCACGRWACVDGAAAVATGPG